MLIGLVLQAVAPVITTSQPSLGPLPLKMYKYKGQDLPKFDGNIRKYPQWRKEMKELVLVGQPEVAGLKMMNNLTPIKIDLRLTETVIEAWGVLDAKYGNVF